MVFETERLMLRPFEETYAVCLKEDNRAIGSIGLMIGSASNLDLSDDEADFGLQRLWCGYFDGNSKSKRAQEKCGVKLQRSSNLYCSDIRGCAGGLHY